MDMWFFLRQCYNKINNGLLKPFHEKVIILAFKYFYDKKMSKLIKNKDILSREQKTAINKFYSSYCKIGYVQHAFYTEKTGIFSPYYIPDSIYFSYIDRTFNDWEYAKYTDNKCNYWRLFRGVSQPYNFVYRENGYWFNSKHELIAFDVALDLLLSLKEDFFIKIATESYGGKGVTYINWIGLTPDFLEKTINQLNGDLVIQKVLKQSPVLSAINPSSVNTIRVLSFLRRDGFVKIYSRVLRMGIGKSKVDNASSGGITCGIKLDGKLKNIAYKANGDSFEEHPTTHIKFDNLTIPNIDKIDALVKKLHIQIPRCRLVSWDIALSAENEPILIEVNLCQGELDFHQLNNGPLFGEDTQQVLEEIFK